MPELQLKPSPAACLGRSGQVVLSADIIRRASDVAAEDFQECVDLEFSGEEVRDLSESSWMKSLLKILPVADLRRLGLKVREDRETHIYATCGLDMHIDEIDGLSIGMALHSDGFTFKQGNASLRLEPGCWFIFDDRMDHAVEEETDSTSLLVFTAALAAA